ncbi:CDP-alcohol phosphatidyltransferase family protein [Aestuariivirga litoralis]|uniref:CDP-alcohol phosphatidyltransferase family protein n=1 Tax=Aestuariivirga litoralis TaxID=2650924 RepID=UPI0018C847C2|nr:CDP-alcohol phosphatidyltransferase family protein [Aestuariivirga litoralis]MBG1230777.1 CDP-alcohol phosphatidyltransferase family protein [Aestuariivirga litoralis]
MTRPTLKAISQDYWHNKFHDEIRGDWGSAIFYRLPAFALARVAMALHISPTTLTLAGLVATVMMAVVAWFWPPNTALPLYALFGVLFSLFDCADGPLARATGKTSPQGAYLDAACDGVNRITGLAALGLITDGISPGPAPSWLALGLFCAVCATFGKLTRSDLKLRIQRTKPNTKARPNVFELIHSGFSGLDTLLPLLALLAWSVGQLPTLMIALCLYHGADTAIAVASGYFTLTKR